MANPERGEHAVVIDGVTYLLKQSMNACIEVEALFSKLEGRKVYWAEVLDAVNAGSLLHKRAVFWAMLRAKQPAITLEQAGDLSDALDQQAMTAALVETAAVGSPDPVDVQEVAPPTRPRKARVNHRTPKDGIGAASSSGVDRLA